MFTSEQETRGLAMAALSLSFGTISYLHKSRLLSNDDLVEMFETPLTLLESLFPTNDPSTQAARLLLDEMGAIVTRSANSPWTP